MTNRIDHTDHIHPCTPAARAACRRAMADQAVIDFISVLDAKSWTGTDWVLRGAARFGGYDGSDRMAAARALMAHFAPSGDVAVDNRRRADGYTITTDPYTIRHIVLRSFS